MYNMHSVVAKEALSFQVTKKCVTNSYTFLDNPYSPHLYADNPSSTRGAVDQIGRYIRGVTVWIQGVAY